MLSDYDKTFAENRSICNHLEKARSYIREHLAENLTLAHVGKAIHISAGYLSRIFNTLAGQSFCDYIRDERMTLARHLLISTDLTVDEISVRCGYRTPGYFATVFKSAMGKSPMEYRKVVKNSKNYKKPIP